MSDPPRYTDRQLALILQRAATLQATADAEHHTLEEIRQIADQVGIPPELVERAAAELVRGQEAGGGMLGEGGSYYASRALPGGVSPSLYPELLSIIRRSARTVGEANELAGALEWRNPQEYNSLSVTVAPGAHETIVRVEGEYGRLRTVCYSLAGAATLIAALPIGALAAESRIPVVAAVALVAGGGLGLWAVARVIWNRFARSGRAEVTRLRDALADRIAKG